MAANTETQAAKPKIKDLILIEELNIYPTRYLNTIEN